MINEIKLDYLFNTKMKLDTHNSEGDGAFAAEETFPYEEAKNIIGQINEGSSQRPTGAGSANPDAEATDIYKHIRNMDDEQVSQQISQISSNTRAPENVVSAVFDHIFIAEHEIPIGPNEFELTRFEPDITIAQLWQAANEGSLSAEQENDFQRLLAHEYVEQALMKRGLPYRSPDPEAFVDRNGYNRPVPGHYGAHDIAPLVDPNKQPFNFWNKLGLSTDKLPQGEIDLSKLDDLVNSIWESIQ